MLPTMNTAHCKNQTNDVNEKNRSTLTQKVVALHFAALAAQNYCDHPTLIVGRNAEPTAKIWVVVIPSISLRPAVPARHLIKVDENLPISLSRT